MTMHRTDVSMLLDVPGAPVTVPVARTNHPAAADLTISEWIADLDTRAEALPGIAHASFSQSGYVDFDALDSVHESSSSSLPR